MSTKKKWPQVSGPVLVGVLAGLIFLVLLVPDLYSELQANIERVQAMHELDLPESQHSLDEAAWDAGWWSLCSSGEGAAPVSVPGGERAPGFEVLIEIDRGDYAAARGALGRFLDSAGGASEPNALAYKAALDMDWVAAARVYRPQSTPRHDRWWGTVFYLAAQQLMFKGELEDAADLYRRADAAYGMHGPYLGLGLVECLVQGDRPLEAWDAYRRALVVLPPDEALTHLARFEALRLEALRVWHSQQPANARVADWLAFYEQEAHRGSASAVTLDAEAVPQVPIELELGDGYTLLGFDYRVEDLETGPFMAVDFYVREGRGEQALTRRVRQVVLNQAPNGAYAWDAVPDGVRPVGWHGLVYSHDLAALYPEEVEPGEVWLCLDAGRIGTSFGLQSKTVPIQHEPGPYIQGGKAFSAGGAALSLGRTWFGTEDFYNYSYVGAARQADRVRIMVDTWDPALTADSAAVWMMAHQTSKGCFREVYLLTLPELLRPGTE